jgi:hypothetical protein
MAKTKDKIEDDKLFADKELEVIEPKDTFVVDRTKSGRGRYQLDGKPLTGVTTICNMQSKDFLITWAATEAYKDSLNLSKEEIKEVLKNKTYAHTRKSDNAKDKGTQAHDLVEEFIKNYIATKEYKSIKSDDEEVNTSIQRFFDWAKNKKVEFLGSEVSVYSRKHWFAGSFDFICKLDGKLLLGDFKTSKQIDDTYFAQGAGYIIAEEETNPDTKFDGVIIVRSILAKEGQIWYEKSSNGKAKKMQNDAFEVKISLNVEREKTYFLSLLNLYRYKRGQEVGKWYEAEVVDFIPEDYPLNN